MANVFHNNLECGYKGLEDMFNGFRTPENIAYCATSDWWDMEYLTPVPISSTFKLDGVNNQRVIVYLDDGYAVKMRPKGNIDGKFHCVFCSPNEFRVKKPDHLGFQEEGNVALLAKYGFTAENGFYLPKGFVEKFERNIAKHRL